MQNDKAPERVYIRVRPGGILSEYWLDKDPNKGRLEDKYHIVEYIRADLVEAIKPQIPDGPVEDILKLAVRLNKEKTK